VDPWHERASRGGAASLSAWQSTG